MIVNTGDRGPVFSRSRDQDRQDRATTQREGRIFFLTALITALAVLSIPSSKKTDPSAWNERLSNATPLPSGTAKDSGSIVITFIIVDEYPYYYAKSDRKVPCDVIVYDRHDNGYPIAKDETCSEKQWDVIDDNNAPEKRECDVAVIVAVATGEKNGVKVDGERYVFRIGSYDK